MCEKKGKVYQKKSRSGGSVLETDFCGALAPRTTRFCLWMHAGPAASTVVPVSANHNHKESVQGREGESDRRKAE